MSDLTVEILKEIRDEIRQTRTELSGRIDATNTRIDETNTRLDATRTELSARLDRLERRQTETEIRLSTELVAVAGAVRELRDVLLEDRKLREKVEDHEVRLRVVERRVTRPRGP